LRLRAVRFKVARVTVRIAPFAGEFAALAAFTNQREQDLREDDDYKAGLREHFLAWDGGQIVGAVHPWLAPDSRLRLYFDEGRPDSYGPLAGAIDGECFAQVDSADADVLERLRSAGFADWRVEHEYRVPVARLDAPVPDGLRIVTADQTEPEPLMMLDCAIRADIPGSDGWQPDPADFREQTYESPSFDPQTYLVALDGPEYVGLVRVWRPLPGVALPRLGCVGVRRAYRRRGLARALISAAFGPLLARGVHTVTTEIDETNVASNALFDGLGAIRTGGVIELRRPARS
jgi:ribosomal protein S18 acetylase RimI-like enzyme